MYLCCTNILHNIVSKIYFSAATLTNYHAEDNLETQTCIVFALLKTRSPKQGCQQGRVPCDTHGEGSFLDFSSLLPNTLLPGARVTASSTFFATGYSLESPKITSTLCMPVYRLPCLPRKVGTPGSFLASLTFL